MADEQPTRDAFDRILGRIDGLPDVHKSKPSTVTAVLPILGDSQTFVVQTYKTDEGFVGFIQTIDAKGGYRVVVPARAMAAIYRQREALVKASRRTTGRNRWDSLSSEEKKARTAHLRRHKAGE